MQVVVVNQANAFMRAAWHGEDMHSLRSRFGYNEDASWSATCAQGLYYKYACSMQ